MFELNLQTMPAKAAMVQALTILAHWLHQPWYSG
jgi:hypothetical protein